jgi:hypothetical protein
VRRPDVHLALTIDMHREDPVPVAFATSTGASDPSGSKCAAKRVEARNLVGANGTERVAFDDVERTGPNRSAGGCDCSNRLVARCGLCRGKLVLLLQNSGSCECLVVFGVLRRGASGDKSTGEGEERLGAGHVD